MKLLLLDAYWKISFTKLHWNKRTRMISSYRVQDKRNAYGETPKASIVFHLELVPEVFQSRTQYSWLCVHIRNPKHQNSSTKMMIEVHALWNFSPSHRQQHSSPSTFTGLHNKEGHTHTTGSLSAHSKWIKSTKYLLFLQYFIFNLFNSMPDKLTEKLRVTQGGVLQF